MGRLTLNVLLSFAQFEREVTAERIRDKISASKKKGLWMGGTLPLGYDRHPDPQRRELVLNPDEADVVRTLFQLYDETPNLRSVEIAAQKLELKRRPSKKDGAEQSPAKCFSRGRLHYLLTNPTYLGRIRHKALDYPGQHPALIDQALWDSVQAKLMSARARPRGRKPAGTDPEPSRCLMGKLRDETGDILTPTHTLRRGRRYSYYISHRLIREGTDAKSWRLPASEIEAILRGVIAGHLQAMAAQHTIVQRPDASDVAGLATRTRTICHRIEEEADFIGSVLDTAALHRDRVELGLNAPCIAKALGVSTDDLSPEIIRFDHPITLRRRGVETRIVAGAYHRAPDPVLIRVLVEAHSWAKALKSGTSLTELAARTRRSEPYIRLRLPLAFLSPTLQTAILDGKQPPHLSVASLIANDIALDWVEQERLFS